MELLREHFYDVDLFAPMKRIHAEGALAMRDNKADRIGAHVNVKGIAADLTGYSVKGYFVRSSIETIELDGGIDGNLAYVDLVGSCYKYDGGYTLTIKLVKDDAEISLLIVTGRVLTTSTDTLVVTEDMISEKEMLEKLNAIGNLYDLETVNKSSLVDAINEVKRSGSTGSGSTGSGGGTGQDDTQTEIEEDPLYSGSFTGLVASAHNAVQLNFNLIAGSKYDVYVNGEKYRVTCENLLINAMLVIGNKHIIQDSQTDTGEPFFIYEKTESSSNAGKQYILVGTSGDYEITIYKPTAGGSASDSGYAALAGKKILILGDSVNAGNGWEGGFANLINEDFEGVTVNNAAVAGAQFAGGDIYGELTLAFQSGFNADYIVFDGGGNDLLLNAPEGTVDIETYSAGGYGAEFDKNTIAGAFEHLATNMQKFFPNAKIIFFNLYKMHPEATDVTYTKQKQVWDLLRECCEKYSIKHVDLWREGNFTPNSEEQWAMFMFDWVHINEAGYRRFWPLIKKALMEV